MITDARLKELRELQKHRHMDGWMEVIDAVPELLDEIERLKGNTPANLLRLEEVKELRRENEKLIRALQHYADWDNWDVVSGSCSKDFPNWQGKIYKRLDFGDTAREALGIE